MTRIRVRPRIKQWPRVYLDDMRNVTRRELYWACSAGIFDTPGVGSNPWLAYLDWCKLNPMLAIPQRTY